MIDTNYGEKKFVAPKTIREKHSLPLGIVLWVQGFKNIFS